MTHNTKNFNVLKVPKFCPCGKFFDQQKILEQIIFVHFSFISLRVICFVCICNICHMKNTAHLTSLLAQRNWMKKALFKKGKNIQLVTKNGSSPPETATCKRVTS